YRRGLPELGLVGLKLSDAFQGFLRSHDHQGLKQWWRYFPPGYGGADRTEGMAWLEFQLLDQCGTQCGFDGFQVPGFQVRQDVFCCGEDLDEVLWHALHRSLFDLDGFGEQESQHICGL